MKVIGAHVHKTWCFDTISEIIFVWKIEVDNIVLLSWILINNNPYVQCLLCHLNRTELLFQVYPDGVRHIRSDKRLQDWKVPGKKQIVKCAVNQRQVVIALTGGELVYFEMDAVCREYCIPVSYTHLDSDLLPVDRWAV